MATTSDAVEDVWRAEAPHVLGALVRRYHDFGRCEDAAQEALVAAATQWRRDGVPDRPRAWLIRVAARRVVDGLRADRARTRREETVTAGAATEPPPAGATADDTLALLGLCCHPALTPPGQVALTLRAVGGLTTAQIAAAFLVPEATMAQRISRAKATVREHGARFDEPGVALAPERRASVRHVLSLIFNEGYATSGGDRLVDRSLTTEAIRLARQLRAATPADAETAGLLALMLLTAARTPARTDAAGDLVPLADQDRTRWDRVLIAEGIALVEAALPVGDVGPFQLQAAIAAVHAEAAEWAATDWPQITVLYGMLDRVAPSPTVTLNRAVAVAMSVDPAAGLALVEPLAADERTARHHRVHAVRAHLLERAGRREEAAAAYALAARLTTSIPEQRYLARRASSFPADAELE